jgi:hypothetical protein
MDSPARKRRRTMLVGLIGAVTAILLAATPIQSLPPIPPSFFFDASDLLTSTVSLNAAVLATVICDDYSADPRFKSESCFWNTYRGVEADWYKEYRMSKSTFNKICRDCVPFLYSHPTRSEEFARYRYTDTLERKLPWPP